MSPIHRSLLIKLNRMPLMFSHGSWRDLLIGFIFDLFKMAHFRYYLGSRLPKQRTDSLKIVSSKHKFIYIGIPLCGTRQMTQLLLNDGEDMLGSARLKQDVGDVVLNNPEYAEYFKFTIVRNPWSRVASCYNRKILNANTLSKIHLISRYKGLRPQMSFKDFVGWLCSEAGQDEHADKHWISQHRLLPHPKEPFGCDYIGRLETLRDDLQTIFDAIGLPSTLLDGLAEGPQNRLPVKPESGDRRGYYDSITAAMIRDRYRNDIERFNYDL